MPKTFSFPDLHLPYENQEKLDLALAALSNAKIGPKDAVLQLGDLYDQYAENRYFRSLKMYDSEEEHEEGYLKAKRFWKTIRSVVSRKARLIQLRGNHDERKWLNLVRKCPEAEHMMDFKSPYQFQGVETVFDPKAETVIDGVLYIHGWMTGGSQGQLPHAKYFNRPVIHGHDHQTYKNTRNFHRGHLFEMSCGLLADYDALPLNYRKTKTTHWVHGFGTCELINGLLFPHYFAI